jgi:hypothetical protein
MAILNITISQTGLAGVKPALAYIETNDPVATILATGYLNHVVEQGYSFPLPCIATVSTKETPTSEAKVGWYGLSHVGANWSLVLDTSSSGGVDLPTTTNHIAVYKDALGLIGEDAATAINFGNIQAGGVLGTAGYFRSYPNNPANGHLDFFATASLGPAAVRITNADHNQDSTYSFPDTGASTANVLMSEGIAPKASITVLKTGSGNAPLIDPAQTEIQIVAGGINSALIFIQVKDGAGNNATQNIPFTCYASQLANGMLVAAAASTGFSLSGSGVVLINGAAVTTQISGVTDENGQCVLNLLDTAKQTSWIVVAMGNGIKISAQMTAGSYG